MFPSWPTFPGLGLGCVHNKSYNVMKMQHFLIIFIEFPWCYSCNDGDDCVFSQVCLHFLITVGDHRLVT